jgi:hypothetical protein
MTQGQAARPKDPAAPWPIRRPFAFTPSAQQQAEALALARQTLEQEPGFDPAWFRDIGAISGWAPGSTLFFEDHRSIELIPEDAAILFEYRSLALAGDGDAYIVSRSRDPAFEAYLRDQVGLGAPHVHCVKRPARRNSGPPIARLIEDDAPLMEELVDRARARSGLNISPFLASGDVWALAAAIAKRAARPVRVCGPSPRLTRRANNKLWFTARATELLGADAAPPTLSTYGLATGAARIRQLAERHDAIVVKHPSSAGSAGNLRFPARQFRGRSLKAIHADLADRLHRLAGRAHFPFLLGVWEHPVAESPSAQLWIPAKEVGPPVLEGVFVQVLEGETGAFVGARRATLPAAVMDRLVNEAQRLGLFFQELGYFGRLSFDAVLIGEALNKAAIHWIECNARWGGVSIPMTVSNRIDASGSALVILQRRYERAARIETETMLRQLRDVLFRQSGGREGVVLLSPPDSAHLIGFTVAREEEDALAFAQNALRLTRA